MTMAVSDIETQDLLKSIDAKLDSIATIMAKNANVAENGKSSEMEQELIRTRKALDVALCSLQDIAESDGDFITGASTPLDEHEYADMMLKEIKRQMKIKTALEQKE